MKCGKNVEMTLQLSLVFSITTISDRLFAFKVIYNIFFRECYRVIVII
jgi:hypothetical protein